MKNVLNRITHGHRQLVNLYGQLHKVRTARNRYINKMHRAQSEYKYDKAFGEYTRIAKIYARILKQIYDIQRHQERVIHRITAGHKVANFINQGYLTARDRNIIDGVIQMMKNLGTAQRTLKRTNLPANMQTQVRTALRNSYIRNITAA
jgi:hypothetical protein